jgi:ketosteroid isomerase-like protein
LLLASGQIHAQKECRHNCATIPAMNLAHTSLLDELQAGMAKTNELFNAEVFGKRNFDALDLIYTADARIMPPGAPMIAGREAIKEFWSGMIQSAHAKSAVLVSDFVAPAGEAALEIGHATLIVAPPGQSEAQMEVKYVVFWHQEDGLWKWHIDIWNSNS